MINNLLTKLDLSNKEQIIYRLILEHGKISPALLSQLAKINRTTIYSVANKLKSKRLIMEDLGGKTIYYVPIYENDFEKTIKKEVEKFKEKEKTLREFQEILKNIPKSKTYSIPKIRFINEMDLEDYLYEAIPKWHKSIMKTDKTWWGFQDCTFAEKFEKWINWQWSDAPKEINLKLFTNKSEIENKIKTKKYAERRAVKFLKSSEFSATQWVVGEYIVFVMTKQHPYYLVEINDSVLSTNTMELFKTLWNKV